MNNKSIYKKWIPWIVLLINAIIAAFSDAIIDFNTKIFSFQVIAIVLLNKGIYRNITSCSSKGIFQRICNN